MPPARFEFMFSAAIQPQTICLFSSTGSEPLYLFSSHCDELLPSDSFIHLLRDRTSEPVPAAPATLISQPVLNAEADPGYGYLLDQTVLHIQSPTLRKTYIRCPSESMKELGLKHPWIHLQVRNMGREWSFEVGISDQLGKKGVLRFSTFQKNTRLNIPDKRNSTSAPILHIPISFPPSSSRPLTPWSTINVHLPTFLPFFNAQANVQASSDSDTDDHAFAYELGAGGPRRPVSAGPSLPSSKYGHVTFVKVYSTCRLRRIWFSEAGPGQKVPWEFELYASE